MATERLLIEISEHGARIVKRGIEDIGTEAGKTESKVGSLRNALATIAAGLGLAKVIGVVSNFGAELRRLQVLSGVAQSGLDEFARTARDLGASTGAGATEAVRGLQELTKAGLDAKASQAALGAVLDLSQATYTEVGESARAVGSVVKGFGVSAAEGADILARASQESKVELSQFGKAIQIAGRFAGGAGADLSVTAAALNQLVEAGFPATQAGSALSATFRELETPSKNTTDALSALGISVESVKPSIVGFSQALETIRAAGLDADEVFRVFGGNAGQAIAVLSQGVPKLKELEAKFRSSSGAAKELAAIAERTIPEAFADLRAALEETILKLEIEPALRASLKGAEQVIQDFSTSLSGSGFGMKDAVLAAALALDSFKALIEGTGAAVLIFLDNFSLNMARIFTPVINFWIKQFNDFFLFLQRAINRDIEQINVLTAQLGGFAGLGTDIRPITLPQIEPLKETFRKDGNDLGQAVIIGFEEAFKKTSIADAVERSLQEVNPVITAAPRAVPGATPRAAPGAPVVSADAAKSINEMRIAYEQLIGPQMEAQLQHAALNELLRLGKITQDDYTLAMQTLGPALVSNKDALGGMVAALKQVSLTAKQVGEQIGTVLVGSINQASGALADFAISGFQNVKSLREGLADLFKSLAKQILQIIIQMLILKAIKAALGDTSGVGGSLNTSSFDAQGGGSPFGASGSAAGGNILGNRPRLVGERGPEIFVPSTAGNVVPNNRIGSVAAPVVVPPPQVNLSVVNVTDPREIASAINSTEGERVILNVLSKNKASLKQMVGS